MAQSDQVVQNATFPSVRADINDNLAALFSQSSGNSAPTVTVAFQPWIDTSSSPPVWKVRNGSNAAWITVGVLDPANFQVGGVTQIANGGTGATTAAAGLAAVGTNHDSCGDAGLVRRSWQGKDCGIRLIFLLEIRGVSSLSSAHGF